ncbi:MAG: hypothetical protein HY707_07190 [Ignavibacteriae bacterium]|nr:hypothetical protein [Ignavibacteriota bacterium]
MKSFEQEIKAYLGKNQIPFEDRTGSLEELDFALNDHQVHFDVKEKKQHINLKNWQGVTIPEKHFFILDDLSARKILLKSPRSFLVVRDNVSGPSYYVFSIVDLLCMPKHRVHRAIEKSTKAYKGKWYVDLRHGKRCASLDDVLHYMSHYPGKFKQIFKEHIDCWGEYEGEEIQTAGTVRKRKHWVEDLRTKG